MKDKDREIEGKGITESTEEWEREREWLFAWNNRSSRIVVHEMYTGYQTLSSSTSPFFLVLQRTHTFQKFVRVLLECYMVSPHRRDFMNNWLLRWDFHRNFHSNGNYHCNGDDDDDEHVVCTLNEIYLICSLSFKFTRLQHWITR